MLLEYYLCFQLFDYEYIHIFAVTFMQSTDNTEQRIAMSYTNMKLLIHAAFKHSFVGPQIVVLINMLHWCKLVAFEVFSRPNKAPAMSMCLSD